MVHAPRRKSSKPVVGGAESRVHSLATQMLLVSVRRVATYAREPVPSVEALELPESDLVDVDLTEVGILDRPHCLVPGQRDEVTEETLRGVFGELDDLLGVVERPYGKTGPNDERARLSGLSSLPPARKMIGSYGRPTFDCSDVCRSRIYHRDSSGSRCSSGTRASRRCHSSSGTG